MKKIEFANNQEPYLNDQNLNQMQDNMEEVSVPEGGVRGQVLRKVSNTDNDVEWSTIIEDSLNSDSSTKALSAKQGKVINDKVDSLIIDNLESENAAKALSAKQGKILRGDVLYENEDGTNQDITLSESADNYQYIEIFGHRAANSIYAKIKYVSGNSILLGYSRNVSGTFYSYSLEVKITGTSLVREPQIMMYVSNGSTPSVSTGATDIYIDKIIGYK